MKVKGKVCVVTGAAGGIGEAVARRFAQEGARGVVVADMDGTRLEGVARDIGGLAVAGNIGQEAEVKRLIAAAEARFGQIDVYYSNAGIIRVGQLDAPNADWEQSWAVHVMSHVYAARDLVPKMLARGEGYLLSTASAAGLLASLGSASYTVTKHAAVALAENLAMQYGDRGIRVSVLCPQAVDTNMLKDTGSKVGQLDGIRTPAEVAQAVIEAMNRESFLILPHPEVLDYVKRKANDEDRWLKGMQRLRQRGTGL